MMITLLFMLMSPAHAGQEIGATNGNQVEWCSGCNAYISSNLGAPEPKAADTFKVISEESAGEAGVGR